MPRSTVVEGTTPMVVMCVCGGGVCVGGGGIGGNEGERVY